MIPLPLTVYSASCCLSTLHTLVCQKMELKDRSQHRCALIHANHQWQMRGSTHALIVTKQSIHCADLELRWIVSNHFHLRLRLHSPTLDSLQQLRSPMVIFTSAIKLHLTFLFHAPFLCHPHIYTSFLVCEVWVPPPCDWWSVPEDQTSYYSTWAALASIKNDYQYHSPVS